MSPKEKHGRCYPTIWGISGKALEVRHTSSELSELASLLKNLERETRVVLEHIGRYSEPVAQILHASGIFVSAINPLLIKEYGNNSLRKVKTDKANSMKIARYRFDNWVELLKHTAMTVAVLSGLSSWRRLEMCAALPTRAR